jgi:hypothetical protein
VFSTLTLGMAKGRLLSALPRLATGANLTGLMLSAGQRANITVRAQAGAGFVPLSEGPFKVEVKQLFGCACRARHTSTLFATHSYSHSFRAVPKAPQCAGASETWPTKNTAPAPTPFSWIERVTAWNSA